MSEWIAKREFELRMDDGTIMPIQVMIGTPTKRESSLDERWQCNICIDHPEGLSEKHIYGTDSLQALQLAIYYLHTEVEMLQKRHGKYITFLDENDLWLGLYHFKSSNRESILKIDI